jgi:hypothetical protein
LRLSWESETWRASLVVPVFPSLALTSAIETVGGVAVVAPVAPDGDEATSSAHASATSRRPPLAGSLGHGRKKKLIFMPQTGSVMTRLGQFPFAGRSPACVVRGSTCHLWWS